MVGRTPVRTEDFLNTLGVATHINFTDGVYAPIDEVLRALEYLGIDHVRDRAPNPSYARVGQLHLAEAAEAGIKFTFHALGKEDPLEVVENIHAFEEAHPGAVFAIEGPNEVNNWPVVYKGLTGTAAAQRYQQDLFDAVNADPLLRSNPILGFTDNPVHASASGWNNVHPYPKSGNQPYASILMNKVAQEGVDPGKPFAITEMGYHTSLGADTGGGWEGVDPATQAKLLLNAYMDAFELGSKATYLYQLLDSPPDGSGADQENHFGLFGPDYKPKPAAVAIHNLTSILHDSSADASTFKIDSFDHAATGLPADGHSFITAKADGRFQIVLWAEPDIWDEALDRPLAAQNRQVDLTFDRLAASVKIFDPLQSAAAIKTFGSVSTVKVTLSDHPIIIEVGGLGAATVGWGDNLYTVTRTGVSITELPGAGDDTVQTTLGSYTLADNVETLIFTGNGAFSGKGNASDNTLVGGAQNDTLNGKAGADVMKGLAGNDVYYVDHTGDRIVEASAGGTDRVVASVDHILGANVENLTLDLGTAITATGNALANKIVGNANANWLDGGSEGDMLTGKGGNDTFVFSTAIGAGNVDTITDFSSVAGNDDRIALENAVFTAFKTPGLLSSAAFRANATGLAEQSADRIIYEIDTGHLFYDSNGSAAGGSQLIADLSAHLNLAASDILII